MKFQFQVIGILRGLDESFIKDIIFASFEAGLDAIEVTMNTDDVLDIVSKLASNIPEDKMLGIGTVRNRQEALQAVNAGAGFLVTPNLDKDVIKLCNDKGIPVISGALTPTEVYGAYSSGSAMVKVFPCQAMGGPGYIKDLLGPYDKIPLMAVGGVSAEYAADYFRAGAKAVGASSALFGKQALIERNIKKISKNVKAFVELCKYALN